MESLSQRERVILARIAQGVEKNLLELSKELRVSANTIRNDIKSLEEKGCIITGRGNTMPAYYPQVLERMQTNISTKLRIAEKTSEFIHDNDTIMISCGTTCSFIGKFLYGKRNVNLITHSTLFLPYARTNPNLNLTLVGGDFIRQEDATGGMNAIEELARYYPRLSIVGTNHFSFESGLTTNSLMAAEVMKKMVEQAQQTLLLVESRKFGKAQAIKIVGLEKIHTLVTDCGINTSVVRQFEQRGIETIIVDV